ncbi:MAG TPA: hypothetical protein VFA62_02110 [Acidimicrobiia bacterium]|nr:hypothetical protein [Acidimicrobiia bacterium]
MPNLIPQSVLHRWYFGWAHPAGRLIFALVAMAIGLAFVFALLRPPLEHKILKPKQGVPLMVVLVIGSYLIGGFFPAVQVLMFWVIIFGVVALALAMIVSRDPRPQDRPTTWAEAMAGAVGVFFLMALGYAVIPHEWITFSDKYLRWTPDKVVFATYAIKPNYQQLRDLIVVVIYGVFFGLNLRLWMLWQKRLVPKPEPAGEEGKVLRTSRFGRPVKSKA